MSAQEGRSLLPDHRAHSVAGDLRAQSLEQLQTQRHPGLAARKLLGDLGDAQTAGPVRFLDEAGLFERSPAPTLTLAQEFQDAAHLISAQAAKGHGVQVQVAGVARQHSWGMVRFLPLPSRLLLAAALPMAGAQARTFHVDAARGDDAQDGLKPETVWRSLAAANRASLVPGDRVLFRSGQTWRGQPVPQNGDAGGFVTYGAFGDGPKAILPGSVGAVKSSPPWTAYATIETVLPAFGANWVEHTIRFHAHQSASDVRLTVFLGGALRAGATLLLHAKQLLKVQSTQAIPLSVDVSNVIWNNECSFDHWNRGAASRTRNIVFEHNTCVESALATDCPNETWAKHHIELAVTMAKGPGQLP
jgi:hypothetical protein